MSSVPAGSAPHLALVVPNCARSRPSEKKSTAPHVSDCQRFRRRARYFRSSSHIRAASSERPCSYGTFKCVSAFLESHRACNRRASADVIRCSVISNEHFVGGNFETLADRLEDLWVRLSRASFGRIDHRVHTPVTPKTTKSARVESRNWTIQRYEDLGYAWRPLWE